MIHSSLARRCTIGIRWLGVLTVLLALNAQAGDRYWPPIVDPPTGKHTPGRFVWGDLVTSDVATAAEFYGEVFGWTFETYGGDDDRDTYTLALADGLPIGGLTFMNFSTEVRFPIVGRLGGVVFLDGGNVWENSWDFNLRDMRYDMGPGLRYNTPVGPFRLDVGFQLNPIEGLLVDGEEQKRPLRVHFSIGHAF